MIEYKYNYKYDEQGKMVLERMRYDIYTSVAKSFSSSLHEDGLYISYRALRRVCFGKYYFKHLEGYLCQLKKLYGCVDLLYDSAPPYDIELVVLKHRYDCFG